ncbi:MAG: hypothetical protein MI867_22175 [Pseudomonadales bacterium]|nr:hypothetical protein [Pseudomonadales bacterium]
MKLLLPLSRAKTMLAHPRALLAIALSSLTYQAWSFDDRFSAKALVEFHASRDRGAQTWLDQGLGKLRYDRADDGIQLSQGALITEWDFDSPWKLAAVWHTRDVLDKKIDSTEAYLRYKPLPTSSARLSVRIGAFYPKISLENKGRAWINRFLISNSAINTWIGEEIRTIGGEGTIRWLGRDRESPHSFSLFGAFTTANDPAGTLLAWRGWAIHDRQTSLTERLPLPDLPSIQPGQIFENQPQWLEPFSEIDDRIGWYAGGSWSYDKRHTLTVMAYDNEADPSATDEDDQYAWHTDFYHLAWRFKLTENITWLSQWMTGSSVMGIEAYQGFPLDIDFESSYGLLTYKQQAFRFSLRYDHFEVIDKDETPNDNNDENGHAWAFACLHSLSSNIMLGAEYGLIKSDRMSRAYHGKPTSIVEKSFKLVVRLFI